MGYTIFHADELDWKPRREGDPRLAAELSGAMTQSRANLFRIPKDFPDGGALTDGRGDLHSVAGAVAGDALQVTRRRGIRRAGPDMEEMKRRPQKPGQRQHVVQDRFRARRAVRDRRIRSP